MTFIDEIYYFIFGPRRPKYYTYKIPKEDVIKSLRIKGKPKMLYVKDGFLIIEVET